mgnify:CR=1 FL=1
MSYIGTPPSNAFTSLLKQDFSTSATTGYTLDHAVNNANDIALFINFVRQEPTAGYAASGTTLTLTSATASSDDMYCVYLGQALQTVNPANASVGSTQLSPTAITGQTALTSVASDDTVLISDTSASGALKKMTRANFVSGIGGTNTPAFHAYLASNQTSIPGSQNVKVSIDTEVLDTDNNFASNRFTPTTAGKYFIYGNLVAEFDTDKLFQIQAQIFKNGSSVVKTDGDYANDSISKLHAYVSTIVDMNGSSDYVEFYGFIDRYGGGTTTGTFYGGTPQQTYLGGYKLIT